MSLKCMIDKWLHKGQISQEEYDAVIKKLDGHDKQIRADAIEELALNPYSKGISDGIEYVLSGQYAKDNNVCTMCVDCPKNCPLDTEEDTREYSADYYKGYADALDIDMDKPMHFTDEQKAWVKKYLSINGERQRADGAREFAEWLTNYAFDHIDYVCNGHFINRQGRQISVDAILSEWQKGVENE